MLETRRQWPFFPVYCLRSIIYPVALRGDASASPSPFFFGSRAKTFLAFAARVVPSEGPTAAGARSQATVRAKLALLLKAFEWGAVFRYGARFARLSAANQDAYLRAWESSPVQSFRFGFSSLRNLVLLAFYTQPESWSMIGYPGPRLGSASAIPAPTAGVETFRGAKGMDS